MTGCAEVKDEGDDDFYNTSEISNKIIFALKLSEKEKKQFIEYVGDGVITKKEIEKLYS